MSSERPVTSAEAMQGFVDGAVPFVRKVGVRIDEVAPRRVRVTLPVDATNLNHVGSAHAGVLFTFGETCGGAAMAASFDLGRVRLVVKEAQIAYLKLVTGEVHCTIEVPEADVARVTATAEAEGRALYPLSMEMTGDDGVVMARMTCTYHLKKL